MIHLRQQLALYAEAGFEILAAEMVGQHLDRYLLLVLAIVALCEVDAAHAAATEKRNGLVDAVAT